MTKLPKISNKKVKMMLPCVKTKPLFITIIQFMNRFSPRWFAFCVAQLAIIGLCHAQSKTVQNKLQPPPANITIDGDPKEWGDSLPYYNKDKQINYALANDQDNIYMAIRINDRSQQIRVLRAGLTLS